MHLTSKIFGLSLLLFSAGYTTSAFMQTVHFNYNYDSLTKLFPQQKSDRENIKLLVLLVEGAPEISRKPTAILEVHRAQLIELNRKSSIINIETFAKLNESYIDRQNRDLGNARINANKYVELFDKQNKGISPFLTKIRTHYNFLNKQEERFEFN